MEYFLKCNNKKWNAIIEQYLYFLTQQLLKDCPEQVFFEAIATVSRKVILRNGFWFTLFFSEGRPSRGDISVLVAHNDDPTGKNKPV